MRTSNLGQQIVTICDICHKVSCDTHFPIETKSRLTSKQGRNVINGFGLSVRHARSLDASVADSKEGRKEAIMSRGRAKSIRRGGR